jgi:abequosyltransferase
MEDVLYLSICIPTYNRAEYLDRTIISIVTQPIFLQTNHIEIVISDNCSVDNTTEIVTKYIVKYGEKIKYYRNDTNIGEANVEAVLKLGNGVFLKLNNDTLNHFNNSLNLIIDFLKQNIKGKPELFFSNGLVKKNRKLNHTSINSFIRTTSFYSTWIACFGIWKDDIDKIENFNTIIKEKLISKVLFELIIKKQSIVIENSKIFKTDPPANKGGYNYYEVFVANYINILNYYYKKNYISKKVLFLEKVKLFIKFLIPWTLILQDRNNGIFFTTSNGFKIIWKQYKFHPILYIGILYYILKKIKKISISNFIKYR